MSSTFELHGAVAIVTGGANGIGAGIARSLVEAGARVAIADIDLAAATEFAATLGQDRAIGLRVDVSDWTSCAAAVAEVDQWAGSVDILVNNAGIAGSSPIAAEDISENEWDRVFDVNTKGTFGMCRAVIPGFISRRAGKIVNIASQTGKQAFPKWTHYSASKFAIIGLTQGLAFELGPHNINVNAVCPGDVFTPLQAPRLARAAGSADAAAIEAAWADEVSRIGIPLGRPQTPSDIGAAVVYLASEAGRNVTGQAINVTGGTQVH